MKKLLLAGLPVLIILVGMPILATLMVLMSTTAAAECRTQTSQGTAPTELGDLGDIDGPVGGPVKGQIGVASANIPTRSGPDGFRASMPKVLSTNPDFVTLSEAERSQPGLHRVSRPRLLGLPRAGGERRRRERVDGQRRALEERHVGH